MADDDGFVTAYATPSVHREPTEAEREEFAAAQREGRPARLPVDSVTTAVGVELTQQEQAIWDASFGSAFVRFVSTATGSEDTALDYADSAVRAFRRLGAGPRCNLGKVV